MGIGNIDAWDLGGSWKLERPDGGVVFRAVGTGTCLGTRSTRLDSFGLVLACFYFLGFGYLGVVVFRLAVCRLRFMLGSGYRLSGLSGSVSSGSSSSRLECVFLLEISHRLGLLPLKSMAIRASARFRLNPSSPPFPLDLLFRTASDNVGLAAASLLYHAP